MNESLLNKLLELKNIIENDENVLKLKELDEKLDVNEDVMKLSYKKDMMIVEYENALKHFGENSKELLNAQKNLHLAKLELDSYPLVKEYNECYSKVRLLYKKINDTLFEDFLERGDRNCD